MKSISKNAFVNALYGHRSVFLGTEKGDFNTALRRVHKAIENGGLSKEYARTCDYKGNYTLGFSDGSHLCIDQKGQCFVGEEETGLYVRQIGDATRVWYWVCD